MALTTYDGTFGSSVNIDLTGTNALTIVWEVRDDEPGRTSAGRILEYTESYGSTFGNRDFTIHAPAGAGTWEFSAFNGQNLDNFNTRRISAPSDGLVHKYVIILDMAASEPWRIWRDGNWLPTVPVSTSAMGSGNFNPPTGPLYVATHGGTSQFAKITAGDPVVYPYRMTDAQAQAASTPDGGPVPLPATTVGATGSSSNTGGGEGPDKLVDGDPITKWFGFGSTAWVEFNLDGTPTGPITQYRIVSGNDVPGRDPRDWTLKGSNDSGATWTVIDQRTGVDAWTERRGTKEFTAASPGTFTRLRWEITANNGDSNTQVSELSLWTDGAVEPSGTLAGTTPAVTGTFDATHVDPPATGDLAGTAPDVTGSFAATAAVAVVDGTLTGAAPSVTGSFSGGIPNAVTGALGGTAPAVFGAFAGSYAAPVIVHDTSTRYANDGYNYDGMAAVYFEDAIAPTPAHINRAKVMQVHQSMSAPNLVNGVPR